MLTGQAALAVSSRAGAGPLLGLLGRASQREVHPRKGWSVHLLGSSYSQGRSVPGLSWARGTAMDTRPLASRSAEGSGQ